MQTGIEIIRDSFQGADLNLSKLGGDLFPTGVGVEDTLGNPVFATFNPIDTPPNWQINTSDTNGEDYALIFRVRSTRGNLTTYLKNNPEYFLSSETQTIDNDTTWIEYVANYEPSIQISITGGLVIQYDNQKETVYRFVPDPYIYNQDSIYRNFNGVSLTNLITSRTN